MRGDKDNPCSRFELLHVLSADTGIPVNYMERINTYEELRGKPSKQHKTGILKYSSTSITAILKDGSKVPYMLDGKNTKERGEDVAWYEVKKYRDISDFNQAIEMVRHRISEGGGWYSDGKLYKYKGKFYF